MDPNPWNYSQSYGRISHATGMPAAPHGSINRYDLPIIEQAGFPAGLTALSPTLQPNAGRPLAGIPQVNYGHPLHGTMTQYLDTISPFVSQAPYKSVPVGQPPFFETAPSSTEQQLNYPPSRYSGSINLPSATGHSKSLFSQDLLADKESSSTCYAPTSVPAQEHALDTKSWGLSNFVPTPSTLFGNVSSDVLGDYGLGSHEQNAPPPAHSSSSSSSRISAIQRNPYQTETLFEKHLSPTSKSPQLYHVPLSSYNPMSQNPRSQEPPNAHSQTGAQPYLTADSELEDLTRPSQPPSQSDFGAFADLTSSVGYGAVTSEAIKYVAPEMNYDPVSPATPIAEDDVQHTGTYGSLALRDLVPIIIDNRRQKDQSLPIGQSHKSQQDMLMQEQSRIIMHSGASKENAAHRISHQEERQLNQLPQEVRQLNRQPQSAMHHGSSSRLNNLGLQNMRQATHSPMLQSQVNVGSPQSSLSVGSPPSNMPIIAHVQQPPIPVQAMPDSTTKPKRGGRGRKKKSDFSKIQLKEPTTVSEPIPGPYSNISPEIMGHLPEQLLNPAFISPPKKHLAGFALPAPLEDTHIHASIKPVSPMLPENFGQQNPNLSAPPLMPDAMLSHHHLPSESTLLQHSGITGMNKSPAILPMPPESLINHHSMIHDSSQMSDGLLSTNDEMESAQNLIMRRHQENMQMTDNLLRNQERKISQENLIQEQQNREKERHNNLVKEQHREALLRDQECHNALLIEQELRDRDHCENLLREQEHREGLFREHNRQETILQDLHEPTVGAIEGLLLSHQNSPIDNSPATEPQNLLEEYIAQHQTTIPDNLIMRDNILSEHNSGPDGSSPQTPISDAHSAERSSISDSFSDPSQIYGVEQPYMESVPHQSVVPNAPRSLSQSPLEDHTLPMSDPVDPFNTSPNDNVYMDDNFSPAYIPTPADNSPSEMPRLTSPISSYISSHNSSLDNESFNDFMDSIPEPEMKRSRTKAEQKQMPMMMSTVDSGPVEEDDDFKHLVGGPPPIEEPPTPSPPPPVRRRRRKSKIPAPKIRASGATDTFNDSFLSFLHGKKPITLASVTFGSMSRKPKLPKYIPEPKRPMQVRVEKDHDLNDDDSSAVTFSDEEDNEDNLDSVVANVLCHLSEEEAGEADQPKTDDDKDVVQPVTSHPPAKNRPSIKPRRQTRIKRAASNSLEDDGESVFDMSADTEYIGDVDTDILALPVRVMSSRKAKDKLLKMQEEKKHKKHKYASDSESSVNSPISGSLLDDFSDSEPPEKDYDSDKDPAWTPFETEKALPIEEMLEFDDRPKRLRRKSAGQSNKRRVGRYAGSRPVQAPSGPVPLVMYRADEADGAPNTDEIESHDDKDVKQEDTGKPVMTSDATDGKEDFMIGNFIIDKANLTKAENFPIWKIESGRMLHKYASFMEDGKNYHRPISTYSSWSVAMRLKYRSINVRPVSLPPECGRDVVQVKGEETDSKPEVAESSPEVDEMNPGQVENAADAACLTVVAFSAYIQALLKQAIEAKTGSAMDSDVSFDDVARKRIEEFIEKKLTEIDDKISWLPDFQECIRRRPHLQESDRPDLEQSCQACEGASQPAIKSASLSGLPYDGETLQEVDDEKGQYDTAQEFMIGKSASQFLHRYHSLYHFKYEMYQKCLEKVTSEQDEGSAILEQCALNKDWLSQCFDELKVLCED